MLEQDIKCLIQVFTDIVSQRFNVIEAFYFNLLIKRVDVSQNINALDILNA